MICKGHFRAVMKIRQCTLSLRVFMMNSC